MAANATTITISGYGFSATPSHDAVTFNDGAVGAITAATRHFAHSVVHSPSRTPWAA